MKNASLLIHPEELSYKWIDRMVAHKIPTLGLHPVGGLKTDETFANLLKTLEQPEFRAMVDDAIEKGLKIEYEMHVIRYLLPASEFDAHPDWFRMNDQGERVSDFNFCASNEEALDFVAERAAEVAKKLYRGSNRYFMWLDDSKNTACHCPKCREFSPSDQQLIILNRMLARLQKDNPDAELAYLAYHDCIKAPTKVKPIKGIFVEYAPISRDFHRPLCESEQSEPLEALIALFGKTGAKALDYWYDNSLFSKWKKPPVHFEVDAEVLHADFAYYRSLGFEDIGCFACYLGKDYEDLYGEEPDISEFAKAYYTE
ncbi:MAG: DUF4838 domain-containing protein [Clostridia bacterium]|nr:DUF4838 domain-containing protein [Clostridia bacterium]MBR2926327.1 DUF4838 domain-containing protein [Clostridia bacterium]